jgi:hypothetical protein
MHPMKINPHRPPTPAAPQQGLGVLLLGDLRRLSDEWMSMGYHLGMPMGLYLCPWGDLGRASPCLARDPPWEISKLGFHKISLVQIFLIRSLSLPAPYLPRMESK